MSKENMTIEIDIRDVEEIERNIEILAEWMMNHYTALALKQLRLQLFMIK